MFSEFFLGGAAVEFLAVGPGGLYAVEVYRWLTRETGTAFPERMAADLTARCAEIEAAREPAEWHGRRSGGAAGLRLP